MPRYKEFSEFQKGIIAEHVNDGWGARRIADKYHWQVSTVQSLIPKYKKNGHLKSSRSNCSRKRKTDNRTDQAICREVIGTP